MGSGSEIGIVWFLCDGSVWAMQMGMDYKCVFFSCRCWVLGRHVILTRMRCGDKYIGWSY